MNVQGKKTITLAAKGLGVVAFVTTAYLAINIGIQGQKLKDFVPITKSYQACNDRIQQTGNSYLDTKLAHASMTAGFVKGSSECLKESGESLSEIGGLSASLMSAVVEYSKNVSNLHKLVLRPKNKDTYQLLKENVSLLESSYATVSSEFNKTQKKLIKQSSFINNNFFLLSIGILFMSLIINLLSKLSKKSDLILQVEKEASELSLSGKFDNGIEVENFVSESLTAVGLHNVENLLTNYLQHRLKKHAMEMKFDKIDEMTGTRSTDYGENEDLEKISEVVNNVSSKLDLLDSISSNIKEMQAKDDGQKELDKKLENILNVVNAAKNESHSKGETLSENLSSILKKISELEKENITLKTQATRKVTSTVTPVKENKKINRPVTKQVDSSLRNENTSNKVSEDINFSSYDLETCVINCANEVSGAESTKGITFDVAVDSGITLGKSRQGVVKIVRELIRQSIENNKGITEQKVLTIKSKAISSGILLNCTMKQVETIEDLESMKRSSQNFHIFDPMEGKNTNTDMISNNFTRLTDINGKVIGTRYNFCLELDSIENKALPQSPNLFNN